MMLRAAMLAAGGIAGAVATMMLAGGPAATKAAVAPHYAEMPLIGLPVLTARGVSGVHFLRVGAVVAQVENALQPDDPAFHAMLADVIHDVALGSVDGRLAIDPKHLRAAVPQALASMVAPLGVERIVILQSEFRSSETLRALAAR